MRFMSGDGPIDFDEARVKRIIKIHNKHVDSLAADYGGEDKIPDGAYPPLLDMHENESNDRVIGRLTGRLVYEKRDVPKVGKNVPCAVARPGITFLGKETVERAKDGRIYHLSIGIDEKTDKLGELSTVIEPAAPGAMVLKQGKSESISSNKGEPPMGLDKKRLEAHVKRTSNLSAMRDQLTKMRSDLTAASTVVKLTQKSGELTHRLTGLMRAGKLSPAEYKKLDLKKLSAMPSEAIDMVMGTFDIRQPVIDPTQRGSTDAPSLSELSKNLSARGVTRLRSETVKDLKRLGMKLKEGSALDEESKADEKMKHMDGVPTQPGKDPHSVPGQAGDEEQKMAHHAEYMKHMEALGKHLAAGDVKSAAESHKAMAAYHAAYGMKHMEAGAIGDVKSDDYTKAMAGVQSQVDELNTNMARLGGMVEELMSAEKEEGHDLEAGDPSAPAGKPAPDLKTETKKDLESTGTGNP